MIGTHSAAPNPVAEFLRLQREEEEAERRWAAFFRNPDDYAASRHARRTTDDFAERIARREAEAMLQHQQGFVNQAHSE